MPSSVPLFHVDELAHSLVARRRGLKVDSITLFIFGGVSDLPQEPLKAGLAGLVFGYLASANALLPAFSTWFRASRWTVVASFARSCGALPDRYSASSA